MRLGVGMFLDYHTLLGFPVLVGMLIYILPGLRTLLEAGQGLPDPCPDRIGLSCPPPHLEVKVGGIWCCVVGLPCSSLTRQDILGLYL